MPPPAVPYRAIPYARRGTTLSDLVRLRGRNAAEAELRGGEIAAGMWSNLGNIVSGSLNNYVQQKQDAPFREQQQRLGDLQLQQAEGEAAQAATLSRQDAAFVGLLEKFPEGDIPPREVMVIYGPQRGAQIAQGIAALSELATQRVTDARDTAGRLAVGAKSLSPELLTQFWPAIRQAAVQGGLGSEQDIPEQPAPEFLDAVIGWATGSAPEQPGGFTLSPGQQRFDAQGQPIASVNEAPDAPTVGSFEDYVSQRFGERPTADQIAQARRGWSEMARAPVQPGERTPTPTARLNATRALRNDFIRETSSANEVTLQYELMKSALAAAKAGDLAAGSQGVLVTFQKILDPTSVVRESEYARSASGLSLLSRMEGAVDKLSKGGAGVPIEDLEAFVRLAEQFARNQARHVNTTKSQINRMADEFGLDPSVITRGVGPDAAAGSSDGPAIGSVVTYQGQQYRVVGVTNGEAELEPVQ